MLRFVETFRQHNLSATFRANVRAMRATTVTPRLNVAEHPKRSLAFSEFSVVMTCWTLKVHLVVYDLKVTLVAQIVKRHNVQVNRADQFSPNHKCIKGTTPRLIGSGSTLCYPTIQVRLSPDSIINYVSSKAGLNTDDGGFETVH